MLGVFEQPKEVLAEHHIGHDAGRVRHLVGEMERREDVRMLQTGDCLDFALKAFRAERLGQLCMQHLERDGSIVPEVDREKDRGHAAPPELALDTVPISQAGLKLVAEVCHSRPTVWGRDPSILPGRADGQRGSATAVSGLGYSVME